MLRNSLIEGCIDSFEITSETQEELKYLSFVYDPDTSLRISVFTTSYQEKEDLIVSNEETSLDYNPLSVPEYPDITLIYSLNNDNSHSALQAEVKFTKAKQNEKQELELKKLSEGLEFYDVLSRTVQVFEKNLEEIIRKTHFFNDVFKIEETVKYLSFINEAYNNRDVEYNFFLE